LRTLEQDDPVIENPDGASYSVVHKSGAAERYYFSTEVFEVSEGRIFSHNYPSDPLIVFADCDFISRKYKTR